MLKVKVNLDRNTFPHHPKGSSADVGPRFLTSSEIGPAPTRVDDLVLI